MKADIIVGIQWGDEGKGYKSKTDVRNNWHDIMNTDEYRIIKIEEDK